MGGKSEEAPTADPERVISVVDEPEGPPSAEPEDVREYLRDLFQEEEERMIPIDIAGFGLAALLTVIVWFVAFAPAEEIPVAEVAFNGAYLALTLALFLVSRGFEVQTLTAGWQVFALGRLVDLLSGLTVDAPPLTDPILVWALTVVGLTAITLGFRRAVIKRQGEVSALRRQTERLEKFASVIAHDLKSPLSVAQGRLDLAGAADEDAPENLSEAALALDRMELLLDDLTTLAREGTTVRETSAVELEPVAQEVWELTLTFDAQLSFVDPPRIAADQTRLEQLLLNLFQNAIDHAGTDVHVEVGSLPEDDGFYIADDGPGIPAEDRNRVFDSGYTTAENGSGFGLETVRRVAEAHGWSVIATESDEGGARIEIRDVELLPRPMDNP